VTLASPRTLAEWRLQRQLCHQWAVDAYYLGMESDMRFALDQEQRAKRVIRAMVHAAINTRELKCPT